MSAAVAVLDRRHRAAGMMSANGCRTGGFDGVAIADDALDLDGAVPRGGGLRGTTAAPAQVIQCWYATRAEFRAELEAA